ncbi:unnamed protein product [Effrenium voratum]|uniref:Uncharacterized protein n=1 Tax=Effrenium voratum TaxID=2562239 RepID=A0AA36J4U3_9DINO|nr:unnamed protein product [Effrenium voratum]
MPNARWGLKLYQSFTDKTPPRRLADSIPVEKMLTEEGYGLILSALVNYYRPYLDIQGPSSVDKFFYAGDRQKGESFTTFVANKELALQELEMQLGETLNTKVTGRVLLRQVHGDQDGWDYEEDGYPYDEGDGESEELLPDEELEEDMMVFEDKEYDELEATWIQAYHTAYKDVRRDLQARRKERGFVKHRKGYGKSKHDKGSRGKHGKYGKGGKKRVMKGSDQELQSRTRCYNCDELGHFARECPLLKGGDAGGKGDRAKDKKVSFIVSSGANQSTAFMMRRRCQDFQALVDTAAEDAVCGSEAFARMEASLQNWNLKPRVVKSARHLPCAGIGGEAEICKVVDVPTNVAGVNGIIRFTIIQDSEAFQTPPLLPVSYLEAVRAIVNFDTGRYHLPDGRSDYMVRLPTGHRAINILNFDTCAWQLPDNLRDKDNRVKCVAVLPGWRRHLPLPDGCHLGEDVDLIPDRYINVVYRDGHVMRVKVYFQERRPVPDTPFQATSGHEMACLESDGEQEKVKKMGVAKRWWTNYLAKRAHQNDENEEHSKNKNQRSKVRKPKDPDREIPQGIGKPLPRSQAQKHWALEVKECQHPAEHLRCRANRHGSWWTCLLCGARWERLETPASASSSKAPEAPQAKKLLLEKGVEYPQFLPAPRSRPEQGDLEVIVNRMGKPVVSTHKKHDNCQKDNSDLKTAGPIKEPMHAGIQVKQEKNDEDKKVRRPSGLRTVRRSKTPNRDNKPEPELYELSSHSSEWEDEAQKLYAKISRLGYALTTVMIYLSTTSRTMESIPDYLIGNMVQVYGWKSKEGLWDTISIYPGTNEHYQHVDEWCYVFRQPEHMHSWVTDQDGEVIKLDRKEQHYLANYISQNTKVDVMEVYSPPRLAKRASRLGLRPGASLDLVTGWDFNRADHRQASLDLIRRLRPALVVLSPPCTVFSQLRALTNYKRNPRDVRREEAEGRAHVEHAVRIAWIQISGGRGFLFEHPLRAKSWTTTSLEELKEYPEVKAVTLDMCRFGLQTPDSSRTRMMPAKKPTLIITNIPEIASALNRRCQGHHEEHQLLVGDRRANNAAVYPQPFVDEILKALRKHIRASHFPVVELKDRWEVRHNQLICRHFQPRQQLCTLEECEEFDFPVEKFTGKRTTTKTYEDGSTKQSVDDWRFHTSTTTSSAAQRWTGTTAFDLIIEVMLPADYQNRATWISAAAAHPIQEYVTAEGAKQEILAWVKKYFKCPLCERRKKPGSQRPGHLARAMGFNECIGIDLFFIKDRVFLNVVCLGTSLQIVEMINDKTSEQVTAALLRTWFAHYGAPRMLICDQGGEFVGSKFADTLTDLGVIVHYTDVASPWQNGRVERFGGSFKSTLETVIHELTIQTEEELQIAVASTQTSSSYLDRELHLDQEDTMARAREIRDAAAKAWMRSQDNNAVRRADKANTRMTDLKDFKPNDTVYVWRENNNFRGWSGPGVVVAISENNRSLWVSLRGYLLKVSKEHLRHATSEESLGVELIKVLSAEMLEGLESGNIRHYRDLEDIADLFGGNDGGNDDQQSNMEVDQPMPYPFSNVESQPWPTARSNTTLFEVYDQETEVQDGARWCEDRIRGTWYMKARSSQAFKLEDSVCLFSNKDKRFYLTKAKESPGQVEFSKLQGNEKQVFRQARAKEFKSLVDSGAITVLSVEESIAFAQAHPEHVLTSRFVDRWKPTEDFAVLPEDFNAADAGSGQTTSVAPKSRWCVVGWKDPMVHQIERSAPTPMTSSMYLFMALTAGRQWRTFLEVLVKELGYRVNAYDRCVLTLDNESGIPGHPTEGIIVVEVDDILESGNERHRNKMAWLEKKLRFGKIINLREHPEGTGYAGRRIMQGPDGSFQYTMADYIKNRLKYVRVERKYLKKDASTTSLKEDEINQLRGVVAAINWIAREGRPDVSAAASILSGCFEKPLMQHVLETNQVVDHLKNHHVVLKVHHIPEEQVRHLVISDASYDPTGKVKPQHGWIQAITTPQLNRGEVAPVSLMSWKSRRLRRKAGNTLLCESIALSTALGAMEKQVAVWRSFCKSKYDPRETAVEVSEEVQMGLRGPGTVIASESVTFTDPLTVAVADAKSLYDASASEQAQGDDDRSALEIGIIQESIAIVAEGNKEALRNYLLTEPVDDMWQTTLDMEEWRSASEQKRMDKDFRKLMPGKEFAGVLRQRPELKTFVQQVMGQEMQRRVAPLGQSQLERVGASRIPAAKQRGRVSRRGRIGSAQGLEKAVSLKIGNRIKDQIGSKMISAVNLTLRLESFPGPADYVPPPGSPVQKQSQRVRRAGVPQALREVELNHREHMDKAHKVDKSAADQIPRPALAVCLTEEILKAPSGFLCYYGAYRDLCTSPRRLADSIPVEKMLTEEGYGLILSALVNYYRPYLDIQGPGKLAFATQFSADQDVWEYEEEYAYEEGGEESEEVMPDEELEDDMMLFEDKEYDEVEATWIQAYHTAYKDVRRDLQARRKERGFVKHRKGYGKSKHDKGSRGKHGKQGKYGEAEICKVVDVPTNVAGVNGIIRFTVIQDSEAFQTPPLLPVSYTWRILMHYLPSTIPNIQVWLRDKNNRVERVAVLPGWRRHLPTPAECQLDAENEEHVKTKNKRNANIQRNTYGAEPIVTARGGHACCLGTPASASSSKAPEAPQAQKLMVKKGVEYPQFLPAPSSRPEQGDLEVTINRIGKPEVATHKKHNKHETSTGDNLNQKDAADLKTSGPIKDPKHADTQVGKEKVDEDKKTRSNTTLFEVYDQNMETQDFKSLTDSGAITVLSIEESLAFTQAHPEHVLTSRFVDRWKPTEDFAVLPEDFNAADVGSGQTTSAAPKSRWCVVGWKDPMVHQIERSAPTPMTSSMYLFMALTAGRQWSAFVKDAKTAFLQSKPTTRKQKLAVKQPSDEALPGLDPRQLLLLNTEMYGLVSGRAWWRRTFLEVLVKELGYRVNAYDRCVLTLDNESGIPGHPPEGIIVVEVDDILESGNERRRKKMAWLEKKLKFGKIINLQEHPEGTGYAGRRIMQGPDGSFQYTMADYIKNRLKYVRVERKYLKKDASTTCLKEDEIQPLRGVVAAINWIAREGRPHVSAAASILSGCFEKPVMQHVLETNQVVDHLRNHHVVLKVHHIPEEQVRHLVISDASYDPTGKVKPQHGWIQALTTPQLNRGEVAPVSLMSWKSRRLRRKAGNALLCESIALSTALGAMEKQVAVWRSFCKSKYDPRFTDPLTIAVADAKSLYDASASEQAQGDDDRSALEIGIIQESIAKLSGRMRWIPHNFNPADALTKLKAHMEPMMKLLKSNSLVIEEEDEVLNRGRQGENRLKSRA